MDDSRSSAERNVGAGRGPDIFGRKRTGVSSKIYALVQGVYMGPGDLRSSSGDLGKLGAGGWEPGRV